MLQDTHDGDLRRLPAVLLEVDLLGFCTAAALAAGVAARPLPIPRLPAAFLPDDEPPAALLARGVGEDRRWAACRLRDGCALLLASAGAGDVSCSSCIIAPSALLSSLSLASLSAVEP